MPMVALLLRCLLCLCLVANGTASAMAGLRMQAPQEAPVVAEPPTAMAMPCHEQGPMLAKAPTGESPAPAKLDDSGHAGSDCCGSAACTCDCMQVAQAELIVPMLTATRLPHRESLPVLRDTYAPPALSSPLRPPIEFRA